MRSRGGRTIKVSPVDDDPQVQDHPERGRIEALFDQNLFKMHIRRERSSAYWFAASLWGMSGLVMGGIMGAFIMYQSMVASIPVASDAMARAAAMEQARNRVDSRPALPFASGEQQPAEDQQR